MSAFETAKEIVRIGSTAGLNKDVIDLLEKKAALLTEEIARLQSENLNLRTQLQQTQPAGFAESDGLLWKRSATGFERRPYCPDCPSHPVMMAFPPGGHDMWACPSNHTFDYDSKPPTI